MVKRGLEKPLASMVIAITGTLSVQRSIFEDFIVEHGGSVAKSVTNSCTHLVSAERGTKKCQDAEAKGVVIVDEQWIRSKVNGDGSSSSNPPAAKKTAIEVASASSDGIFSGFTFNVAGTAEFKEPMEELITSNGGKMAKLDGVCNFMVCPDTSLKALRTLAEKKHIELVDDQWVLDKVVGGEPVTLSVTTSSSSSSVPAVSSSTATIPAPKPVSAKPSAAPTTAGGGKNALKGLTFAITGTLSVTRTEFESFITSHGGTVAKSVTNSCTHLISAETGTKKCADAIAKGLAIVDEDWVRARVAGTGSESAPTAVPTPAATAAPAATKRGKKATAVVEEEDAEEQEEEAQNEDAPPSKALAGLCFAITGTLSVPRAQFEGLIKKHGGTVAKTVTNSCTHLVSSETGTKKCQDAEEKGVAVIDEDWVRKRITLAGDTGKTRSNVIPPQSFVPLLEYVNELLETDEDEGRVAYQGGKKNVGKEVFNRDEDPEMKNIYIVTAFKKIDGEEKYILQPKSKKDREDTIEVDEDELADNYYTLPAPHVINRWDRYQNKRIGEGVWMSTAETSMQTKLNKLIDEMAVTEQIDYHPGTHQVVRDLVHPSLYPLILDPEAMDTNMHNFWNRPYEKSRFQWLPTEVAIDSAGKATFTSPINNLNTDRYISLKMILQDVFTALVPGMEKVWQYAQYMSFTDDQGDWSEEYADPPAPVSFKNTNLQAVVKIADYVFTPGSTFNGVWHYEGMAHENIVMTGLFYPHSDERLGGGLEFKRQFSDVEGCKLLYGMPQCRPPWVDEIIAGGFLPLGYTTTETGKLMVFPNCHAHRVLEMVNNTTETLRRRLIVFFIVDPNHRIPSSRDHPPMPRTIDLDTAFADRLELMQERKQAKQALNPREIELCEH